MASNLVKQNKMRRLESKKSHSWWWDSHVSPKNSKWLQENLEEMNQNVKRMLKLIEEDADSFAKKAEMYYQKRPELIHLVEEFYRMYRALAERYDNVTGELRKNIPSDLQSQGSGVSDVSSEPPSTSPAPDQRLSRCRAGPRAAGFEFFLGAGGNSGDSSNKEGDETSTLDSESESDDSSVNNYHGTRSSDEEQGLRMRITELEAELNDMKKKFRILEEEVSEDSNRELKNANSEILQARIAGYEEELKVAREKIRLSEEEMNNLKDELQEYKSMGFSNNVHGELDIQEGSSNAEAISKADAEDMAGFQGHVIGSEVVVDPGNNLQLLEEELRNTRDKLQESEKEVAHLTLELQSSGSSVHHLQDQLRSAQKEASNWKAQLEREKREVSKLHDRIARYKSNLSDRDQEIRGLREAISNANKSLSEENSQLQAEITQLLKGKTYLEDNIKELDFRCQSLEEDVRRGKAGKAEMEAQLGDEIDQLKRSINEKNNNIEELNRSLDELKLRYDMLRAEKDTLETRVATYIAEISSKNTQIMEMNKHLHQLHMQHVELIAGAEAANKQVEEMRSRVKELEREVERQQEVILEGAEEKREAIRQLCFSLEHYRNGYHQLRQAVVGHKRLRVMAS